MKLRAVVFDVYKTLLRVGPPPPDGEARWNRLWRKFLDVAPPFSLEAFGKRTEERIAAAHAQARRSGVPFPEVYWPRIAVEAAPELAGLAPAELDDFLYGHAQTQRTVQLMPGAEETLGRLAASSALLGFASNSQPYTLRELAACLPPLCGLERFHPQLRFWSFEAGFSKPDPHVFRLLGARLQARGVSPESALMVGDRVDNDILPARGAGWRAWLLIDEPQAHCPAEGQGDWRALGRWLAERLDFVSDGKAAP